MLKLTFHLPWPNVDKLKKCLVIHSTCSARELSGRSSVPVSALLGRRQVYLVWSWVQQNSQAAPASWLPFLWILDTSHFFKTFDTIALLELELNWVAFHLWGRENKRGLVVRAPFLSASVVCALIGRRIKCTRQQSEGSQAVAKEAAWEEYVVVCLACWLRGEQRQVLLLSAIPGY